jgi:hypothetical protein
MTKDSPLIVCSRNGTLHRTAKVTARNSVVRGTELMIECEIMTAEEEEADHGMDEEDVAEEGMREIPEDEVITAANENTENGANENTEGAEKEIWKIAEVAEVEEEENSEEDGTMNTTVEDYTLVIVENMMTKALRIPA